MTPDEKDTEKLAAGCGIVLLRTAAARTPHADPFAQRLLPLRSFWQGLCAGVYSIEADVFLHDGRLLVGHDVEDLSPDMTFESLYVEPIVTLLGATAAAHGKDSDERLQLMVELNRRPNRRCKAVTALLGRYPEVFDPA